MRNELIRLFNYVDSNKERYIEELKAFLEIPSISADSSFKNRVSDCAEWLCEELKKLNVKAELHKTEGHPIVYGTLKTGGNAKTLLIYGHYDVQPPDPIDKWESHPFEPQVRNGFIYARGASDDKGQLFTYIKALEACLKNNMDIPINLRFLFEGEEEIGSPNLGTFLRNNKNDIEQCSAVVISDGHQFSPGIPAITYGLRGLAYFELEVVGPRNDLHSGGFGGIVLNPIHALTIILSKLKDERDKILIDGFYDDVKEPDDEEKQMISQLPFDEENLKEFLGIKKFFGEDGYSILERKTIRPTLDVNGIWGGYQGEGAKTVIPSRAGAKLSMRLVPNQRRERINELFMKYIRKIAPEAVEVSVKTLHGANPVLIDMKLPEMKAAARALELGFGRNPVFIREGGSIPVVNMFVEDCNIKPVLLIGFGRPDDNIHGPNERFNIDDFIRGIKTAVALFFELQHQTNPDSTLKNPSSP